MSNNDQFLGFRVKALRKRHGLSLSKLAQITGLSAGYISQLERDLTQPSMATMIKLAQYFGVSVQWFFTNEPKPKSEDSKYIVRKKNRLPLNYEGGITDELLPFRSGVGIELIYCRIPPGAASGKEMHVQTGDEAGYVLQGELQLTIGEEQFTLTQGDGFGFAGGEPHRFFNPGQEETIVLWAITPPEFWSIHCQESQAQE